MGAKLCRPKMMDCLQCEKALHPTEIKDYVDAPQKSFCFEKECPFNLRWAMVRGGKIICWEE